MCCPLSRTALCNSLHPERECPAGPPGRSSVSDSRARMRSWRSWLVAQVDVVGVGRAGGEPIVRRGLDGSRGACQAVRLARRARRLASLAWPVTHERDVSLWPPSASPTSPTHSSALARRCFSSSRWSSIHSTAVASSASIARSRARRPASAEAPTCRCRVHRARAPPSRSCRPPRGASAHARLPQPADHAIVGRHPRHDRPAPGLRSRR
jgi:hypothetical protein